ncbi:MAG: hypothetical protein ABL909_11225 [Sphingopyxis sp.]
MMIRLLALVAALLLPMAAARANTTPPPLVGDTFEISRLSESVYRTSDESSGNSHDQDTIVERVVAVTDAGVELEYDVPRSITVEGRGGNWQLPARVLRPSNGALQLLNADELAGRVDAWLERAGFTRAHCGRHIFTWNVFSIDCDPQSVMPMIEMFNMGPPNIDSGSMYGLPFALAPMPMTRQRSGTDGATYTVDLVVDPDAVRRARAESDIVAAEVTGRELTLDAALRAHKDDNVTGTIRVTFAVDTAGHISRRTTVTNLEITGPDGVRENRTTTETLERRRI